MVRRISMSLVFVASWMILSRPCEAGDAFSSIRCGSDIAKNLIGKTMPNDRVVAIEGRHRDLGLKDMGATEMSDTVTLSAWMICGSEFALLVDHRNAIRDAIALPQHSRLKPEFIGSCELEARTTPYAILAILSNPSPLPPIPTLRKLIDDPRFLPYPERRQARGAAINL